MVCVYGTVGTVNSRVVVRNGSVNGVGTAAVTVTAGAPLFVNIVPSTFAPMTNTDVFFMATVTSTGPVPASFVWYWDMENDGVFEIVVPASASPNAQTTRYGPPGKHTAKVKVVDPTTAREATTTVVLNVP
jgi:hypothetical protein